MTVTDDPEEQAAWWVGAVTGRQPPGDESLQAWLKSGVVLCELINAVAPGSAAPSTGDALARALPMIRRLKEIENIGFYSEAARRYGVPEPDMFVTVDLYDNKGEMSEVCRRHSIRH